MELVQKLGIPMIQFTDQMEFKKKEEQSIDISVLLRMGNKIVMGGSRSGRERRGREEKGVQEQVWVEIGSGTEGQEIEWVV